MCGRVVFTSLPSPTGEGYRVVAASSGLRAQEKTEITRRSPSHGALCSAAADARAVAISTLCSGRVCVSLSRFAGAEHTGRGGRVWTEALLIEAADFLLAGGHPRAFVDAVAAAPLSVARLGTPIQKLSLPLSSSRAAAWFPPAIAPDVRGADLAVMAALMFDRSPCVVAAKDPVAALDGALSLLPLALRVSVNVSAGLRFANSRRATLYVVESIDFDTRRATRGRPVELLDAADLAGRSLGVLEPWLALMSRWCDEGRAADAVVLAGSLRADQTLAEIFEVARICEAIDRREEQPAALDALLATRVMPAGPVPRPGSGGTDFLPKTN